MSYNLYIPVNDGVLMTKCDWTTYDWPNYHCLIPIQVVTPSGTTYRYMTVTYNSNARDNKFWSMNTYHEDGTIIKNIPSQTSINTYFREYIDGNRDLWIDYLVQYGTTGYETAISLTVEMYQYVSPGVMYLLARRTSTYDFKNV